MTERTPVVLGRYMVGDEIRASVEVYTPANLSFLTVVFWKVDDPEKGFNLAPETDEIIHRAERSVRRIALRGAATLDLPPGLYRVHRVFFETCAGRMIRLEGEDLEDLEIYRVEILPEPEESPRVVTFNLRQE